MMSNTQQPAMAMMPPEDNLTPITETMLEDVLEHSRSSARKRMILPLHKGDEDILQRMLNAVQPGSYIRPHRHAMDRGESIVMLRGAILYFTFDKMGTVKSVKSIAAGTTQFGIDIEGGIWHSFVALEPDTVLFEVKPGPYMAETDKEFASWAPEEGSAESEIYLGELLQYSTTS